MSLIVYVINQNDNPLMPCKPSKARKLLRDGRAKVSRRSPFTIQLLWFRGGKVFSPKIQHKTASHRS
jgi:hypothetical protein